jgi:hypothetical protein
MRTLVMIVVVFGGAALVPACRGSSEKAAINAAAKVAASVWNKVDQDESQAKDPSAGHGEINFAGRPTCDQGKLKGLAENSAYEWKEAERATFDDLRRDHIRRAKSFDADLAFERNHCNP